MRVREQKGEPSQWRERLKKEQKADTARRREKGRKEQEAKRASKHTHKNGKLLMRNKTTVMRVILRGPFNVPDENMKERKTREV